MINLTREILLICSYPFSEEQPIPLGWEESIIEISAEILADPSHSR